MEKLNAKWQKLIVWVTGYLNIIAFFIGGGYIYLKTTDEKVKNSAKTSFLLVVGFAVLELLRGIFLNVFNMGDNYEVIEVINDIGALIAILKAIAFATLCVLDLFDIQLIPVDMIFTEKAKKEETEETSVLPESVEEAEQETEN